MADKLSCYLVAIPDGSPRDVEGVVASLEKDGFRKYPHWYIGGALDADVQRIVMTIGCCAPVLDGYTLKQLDDVFPDNILEALKKIKGHRLTIHAQITSSK